MTNFLEFLPSILASALTAGATMWLAFWKFKESERNEYSTAELNDRIDFRHSLMERIKDLELQLKDCHAQHRTTEQRLNKLEARCQ